MIYWQHFKEIIRKNSYFYIPFGIFLIIGLIVLLTISKSTSFHWVNNNHTHFLDEFFVYTTIIGDGSCYIIFILVLLFISLNYFFTGLASFSISGLFCQLIKNYYNLPRPKAYFQDRSFLNFVEGVSMHTYYSFPSGHTATAFSLFLLLSFIVPNKKLGIIFFFAAFLVGFSRVYLLQHFFVDIYFGSLIGVVFTTIIFTFFYGIKKQNDSKRINNSIIQIFSKKKH